LVPFSCGTKSQLVSFSLDLKNYPFLSAIYLDLVLCDGTYRYWTGKCPVDSDQQNLSTLRNISAIAVHVCGDWQNTKAIE
jgi:hypothetical protein